jgi:uncharacterized protein
MHKNVVGMAIALAMLASPAQAQERDGELQARSTIVNVSAMGVATARPDMATIHLGVTTRAATAQEALAENARRMTTLIQTLRRAGLAERDIQTSWVRVSPQHRHYSDGREPDITGYEATNSVRARIRDIDRTGRVIDAVVEAGGNQVHGIAFSRQDVDVQLDLARRDAVRVARERAELYAGALGLRVQRVVSVTEQGAAAASLDDEAIVVTGSRSGGGNYVTPVAPGELETRAQVSVSFELR